MERLPEFVANHLFLFSLLLAILTLLMWNLFGDMLSGIKTLQPDELTHMINREDAKVIDVRPQSDFEKGHIIDAMNIEVDQIEKEMDKLIPHKDKGIVFCCTNGSVSAREARKLMSEGYEKVFVLKGGIMTWQNANLPLTKGLK